MKNYSITPKSIRYDGQVQNCINQKNTFFYFFRPNGEKEREKVRDKEPSKELSQLTAKVVRKKKIVSGHVPISIRRVYFKLLNNKDFNFILE